MGKKLNELKQSFRLDNFRRIKGSAAVLMALVVSGSVATVIFVSQNTLTQFMAARSKTKANWQTDLAVQYGLHLGGYLVANNVILCREGGWSDLDSDDPLCRWTTVKDAVSASSYDLTDETEVSVEGQNRKQLRYTGTKNIEGSEYSYHLFFDLVNWKDARMSSLMGEIPDALCRNTTTLQVVEGKCDQPAQTNCKNTGGVDIPDTHCEYISNMDQDVTIVLLKVVVLDEDDNPIGSPKYAGIRRPLAAVQLEVISPPICNLSCASGFGGLFPECRSSPTSESGVQTGVASMKLRVRNQGPGAIYALSLLRIDKSIDSPPCEDKNSDCTYMTTPDLLKTVSKEVFFPGETFIFEDEVDCTQETVIKELTKIRICQNGREFINEQWVDTDCQPGDEFANLAINQHSQPLSEIIFDLFSAQSILDSWGACMKGESKDQFLSLNKHVVANNKSCQPGGQEGKACGAGKCRYPHIEPRRVFAPGSGTGAGSFHVQQEVLKIIYKVVPPH